MSDIYQATLKMCVEYQRAAESSAREARMFIDGEDKYLPRVIHHQRWAAKYAEEAMMRLDRLIGVA